MINKIHMESLKYFITDIFCIDDIKNVVEIFDLEKNCLLYENIYQHNRIKQILAINFVFNELFSINCPSMMIKTLINKDEKEMIDYILKNTYVIFFLDNDSYKRLIQKLNQYKIDLKKTEKCKNELIKYIEKRHDIILDSKSDSLFKAYELGIKVRYKQESVSKYFASQFETIKANNLLTFNPLNNSINTNILPNKLFNTITSIDCVSFSILHDCYFARMLNDNIVFYIHENEERIMGYIEYVCKKSDKQPVIIAPYATLEEIKKTETFKNYNFITFSCDQEYTRLLPHNLAKYFITTYHGLTNLGKINYIISDGVLELKQQNLFQLTRNISKNVNAFFIPKNKEIIELMFNLITSGSFLHLNGLDKICKYVENNKIELKNTIPKINNRAKNCILIVDNRPNVMNVVSLMITLHNLKQKEWAVVFVGSEKSIDYMKLIFKDSIEYIHESRLEKHKFGIEIYNDILKDVNTWKSIEKYSKCLIIQDDSAIIKKGLEDSYFMMDDYVGPIWADKDYNIEIKEKCGHLCGNGGLSLRTIKLMKNITEQFSQYKNELFNKNLQTIPEDVFFAKYITKVGGKVPSYERAILFGCEQVPCLEAYGYHKVWNYTPPDFVNKFIV